MKLVTAAQMRSIEQACVEAGISLDELMENAGLAVAEYIRDWLANSGRSGKFYGKRVVILIGPGNNGADGFIAGRHLARWGAVVTAVLCAHRKSPDPKRELAEQAGVSIVDELSDSALGPGDSSLESLRHSLMTADVVIDAVLGIGATRPLAGPMSSLIHLVFGSRTPVIALDMPTGQNSDTGELDPAGLLMVDTTLALGFPKLGPALAASTAPTVETVVLDIGIPPEAASDIKSELMTPELAASIQPVRPIDGHKGTFGSTLIIGGSQDYLGAVTMTADAATRSGTGLVFVATPEPVYRLVGGDVPEAIYRALPLRANGEIDPSAAARIALELSQRVTTVVIGPGLGQTPATSEFLKILLSQIDPGLSLVLDADALNILSQTHNWWERLENETVLTPHPGEMGRLMGISAAEVQKDRTAVVLEAARKFNATVVLKGSVTLTASPHGHLRVSQWVNSGLAKGGSGDVLAGLLGGLLAQQPENVFDMASLAVFIHGYAAKAAREELGETGMRATDVSDRLGYFHRDWR